jgi:hypothetical protein
MIKTKKMEDLSTFISSNESVSELTRLSNDNKKLLEFLLLVSDRMTETQKKEYPSNYVSLNESQSELDKVSSKNKKLLKSLFDLYDYMTQEEKRKIITLVRKKWMPISSTSNNHKSNRTTFNDIGTPIKPNFLLILDAIMSRKNNPNSVNNYVSNENESKKKELSKTISSNFKGIILRYTKPFTSLHLTKKDRTKSFSQINKTSTVHAICNPDYEQTDSVLNRHLKNGNFVKAHAFLKNCAWGRINEIIRIDNINKNSGTNIVSFYPIFSDYINNRFDKKFKNPNFKQIAKEYNNKFGKKLSGHLYMVLMMQSILHFITELEEQSIDIRRISIIMYNPSNIELLVDQKKLNPRLKIKDFSEVVESRVTNTDNLSVNNVSVESVSANNYYLNDKASVESFNLKNRDRYG